MRGRYTPLVKGTVGVNSMGYRQLLHIAARVVEIDIGTIGGQSGSPVPACKVGIESSWYFILQLQQQEIAVRYKVHYRCNLLLATKLAPVIV